MVVCGEGENRGCGGSKQQQLNATPNYTLSESSHRSRAVRGNVGGVVAEPLHVTDRVEERIEQH